MTEIEWTDVVWNPTTGCDKVSLGCDNCYALTMAKRLKGMGSAKYQTDGDPRTSGPGFGLAMHDDVLTLPLRWRVPRKVFVNSMSDLFHPKVTDGFIAEVFAVMARATQHTFQILTKRPPRMHALLSRNSFRDNLDHLGQPWPLPNVWLGVSVENQEQAEARIPRLLDTPAAVRWLSCEPLLGKVDLDIGDPHHGHESDDVDGYPHPPACLTCSTDDNAVRYFRREPDGFGIDWVVVGGESGLASRPMNPAWARSLRDECVDAGVPFLFKQWGGRTPKFNGRLLDGRTWDEYPQLANR